MLELIYVFLRRLLCKLIFMNHNFKKVNRHSNGYTNVCKICGKREDVYYYDGFDFYN